MARKGKDADVPMHRENESGCRRIVADLRPRLTYSTTMQTRTHSAIETFASTAIGYCVSLVSQLVILPRFGCHLALSDNLAIGGWFTIVSLARGYLVRRLFNKFQRR
jgi:hypothetical protein